MTKEQGGMAKVALRPFEERDFEPLARLMARTWCAEFPERAGRAASRIELSEYLSHTTWSLVAEKDGTILGALLLAEKDEPAAAGGVAGTTWSARSEELTRAAEKDPDPTVARAVAVEMGGVREEAELDAEFVSGGSAEAAATIKLLIVSPEARGLGLGRRLLDAARDHLRERGADGYHLLTDDSCDVSFYDHLGLRRAMQRRSQVEWADVGPNSTRGEKDDAGFSLYVYAERLA